MAGKKGKFLYVLGVICAGQIMVRRKIGIHMLKMPAKFMRDTLRIMDVKYRFL